MAVEASRRLVELSGSEKNQNGIRRDFKPHDRCDPELEPSRSRADVEFYAIDKIWRQPGEQRLCSRDDIGFHHHIDHRLYGQAILQRTRIARRRTKSRQKL